MIFLAPTYSHLIWIIWTTIQGVSCQEDQPVLPQLQELVDGNYCRHDRQQERESLPWPYQSCSTRLWFDLLNKPFFCYSKLKKCLFENILILFGLDFFAFILQVILNSLVLPIYIITIKPIFSNTYLNRYSWFFKVLLNKMCTPTRNYWGCLYKNDFLMQDGTYLRKYGIWSFYIWPYIVKICLRAQTR